MGKTDDSFVNIWDFDTSKFDSGKEDVEEVVQEVEADGAEKVAKDSSVASEDQDTLEVEQGDEKQAEEEEESKEDASSEPEGEGVYSNLLDKLVEDDVLVFDEEKEYDIETEAGLKELIQETVSKKSEEALNSFKESLGEDANKLLTILEKGGTVEDFVKMEQQIDFSSIPLVTKDGKDLERNQVHLIEDWLKVQGESEEDIEETIQDYIESGILKKEATRAQKKLANWQKKENEKLVAEREKAHIEEQEAQKVAAEEFKKTVLETRDLSGFKVTETKAKKLYDYITKRDKEGKSQFDKDDTPENRLLYAYFAMEGFDKEKLSKEIASSQARTLKKKLSRFTDDNTAPKRSAQQVRRTNQETPSIPWSM